MTGLAIRLATAAATTAGTPPVAQNLDASGGTLPGTNPVAALYALTGGTAIGTIVSPARLGLGVTDGTTQRAFGALAEDAVAAGSADAQTRVDDATVIQWPNTSSGALDGEASWSAWRTNGSEISWADLMTSAHQLGAIYFFGSRVRAAVVQVTGDATIGNTVAVTGLGFKPNLAIALCTNSAFPADTNASFWRSGIGLACQGKDGIEQASSFMSVRDRAGLNTACAQSVYDTRFMSEVQGSAAGSITLGAGLVLESFTDDGAVLRTEDVAAALVLVVLFLYVPHELAIRSTPLSTSTAGSQAITGVGFRPQAYFGIGTSLASMNSTSGTGTAGHLSFGVVTPDDEGCWSASAEDAAGTSDTYSLTAGTGFSVLDNSGGVDWDASHVSFDDDGATLSVGTASTSDRAHAMLFVGERELFAWAPHHRRWRRQLARM